MALTQVLFIRHAEEHDRPGVTDSGEADKQSLTVRGWQRAGALVGLFGRKGAGLKPDIVYTSSVAPSSESKRPEQTVMPLVACLEGQLGFSFHNRFTKHETEALANDIMTRSGTVLVCWEHSQIADCIAALPNPPATPNKWPASRYDLIWRLEPDGDGWRFEQMPQLLLAGDTGVL